MEQQESKYVFDQNVVSLFVGIPVKEDSLRRKWGEEKDGVLW